MATRRCHILVSIALCGLVSLFSPRIEAQSFDCKKASTATEKAICDDQAVGDFDQQLSDAVKRRLSQHPEWRSKLLLAERRWIQYRDAQCKDFVAGTGKLDDCLRDQYAQRLAVIESPDPLAHPVPDVPHVTAPFRPSSLSRTESTLETRVVRATNMELCRSIISRPSYIGADGIDVYKLGTQTFGYQWGSVTYPHKGVIGGTENFVTQNIDLTNSGVPRTFYWFNSGHTFTYSFFVLPPAAVSMEEVTREMAAVPDFDAMLAVARQKKWLVLQWDLPSGDAPLVPADMSVIQGPTATYVLGDLNGNLSDDPTLTVILWKGQPDGTMRQVCRFRTGNPAPPVAATPAAHLSIETVQALASAAARNASLDMTHFAIYGSPLFDPTTRVWSIEYVEAGEIHGIQVPKMQRFRVFVYDTTSHTEVTCLGASGFGATIDDAELPAEVLPFIPKGESAIDLECADLNGDGKADYLLITRTPLTRRTLQILLRTPDGKLVVASENDNVVQPPSNDGINGSVTIVARRDKFEISNTSAGSGGGDIWSFYFEYSPTDRTWLLTRADKALTGYIRTNDDNAYARSQKDFGHITIDEFFLRNFIN